MSSKKHKRGKPQKSTGSHSPGTPHTSPMIAERAMQEITRAIGARKFETASEVDAYVNKLLDDGLAEEASAPRNALEKAQDLMYSAWECNIPEDRIAMAEIAVQISANCADAFSLLGDEKAASVAESRAYYEEAVRAGERGLGAASFKEYAGHFWGVLETRPYMRARLRLATAQWDLGDSNSAIGHLQEMLSLNPGDNQGIRYMLLGMLVQMEDRPGVEQLLAAYPDEGGTHWLYDKALWLILQNAADEEISNAIGDAITVNPSVPAYLLGRKKPPRQIPDYVEVGSDSEASAYAVEGRARWTQSPRATQLLRGASAASKSGKPGSRE